MVGQRPRRLPNITPYNAEIDFRQSYLRHLWWFQIKNNNFVFYGYTDSDD